MNEKIPLKKFAERVASAARISPEEAEADIKGLFALVADELRTGQSVRIKGLGEFKLTSDPQDPVAFVAESIWADEVNAPFAMFEAVPVNPAVTTEELEAVVADPLPSEEITEAAETVAEPSPASEKPAVEVPQEQFTEPESNPVADTPADSEDAVEVVKETHPIDSQPAPVPSHQSVSSPQAAPSVTLAPWPEEEEEENEEVVTEEDSGDSASASGSKSGFGRGFVVGLIIGLAIGALALCAYVIYYVNADTPRPSVETELNVTEPLFPD